MQSNLSTLWELLRLDDVEGSREVWHGFSESSWPTCKSSKLGVACGSRSTRFCGELAEIECISWETYVCPQFSEHISCSIMRNHDPDAV